jgi:hypothetical protein
VTLPPRIPEPGPGTLWPTVSDQPPGTFTGVPVERDPVTGKLLPGSPGGRSDKGRSARPTRVVALVTAGALVVAAVIAVLLLRAGDDAPPAAAPSTTSAAPTTTTPPAPVDPGPRTVPVTLTTVAVTPPPGFAPDPAFGTVGEKRARTWTLTGPCDGTGACAVEHCTAPGQCLPAFAATPNGSGYVGTLTIPVNWASPNCTGGQITETITFTVSGSPSAPAIAGDWVESAAPLTFTGADNTPCGIYLAHYSIASA